MHYAEERRDTPLLFVSLNSTSLSSERCHTCIALTPKCHLSACWSGLAIKNDI